MKTQTMATLVGLGTLAIGSVAHTETVTYIAEGNITSLTDTANLTDGATTWSWRYSFDSDAVDQEPGDLEIGAYALGDWELTLGALTVGSTGGVIVVLDDFLGTIDGYLVDGGGSTPAGWGIFDPDFQLVTNDTSTFGSDALPLTPPGPAAFDDRIFNLLGISDAGDLLIAGGDVKSLEIVPDSCLWDLNNDELVGTGDLILLLGSWGDPYDTADLIELLGNWGPCPK